MVNYFFHQDLMKKFLLLTTLLYCTCVRAQVVDFYKEELQFSVDSVWFHMQGDFYLARKSTTTHEISLSFPVPEGTMSLIDSFKVYDYDSQQWLAHLNGQSAFAFTAQFTNKDSIVLQVQYRQRIVDSSLSYIITTVREWQHPLSYAAYSLRVPSYCTTWDFSLPVDKQLALPNATLYIWQRHNFMPNCDFNFKYKLSLVLR